MKDPKNLGVKTRALYIAAKAMYRMGGCRHAQRGDCHLSEHDETRCIECIFTWLLQQARRQIRREVKTEKEATTP